MEAISSYMGFSFFMTDVLQMESGRRLYRMVRERLLSKYPHLPEEPYFDGIRWTLGATAWDK